MDNYLFSTHKNVVHLEDDTKILLHALDAAAHGATEITIHSPDIDVFILSLRRYPQLCRETISSLEQFKGIE